MRPWPADICRGPTRRSGWRRAPTNRSPSVEMALLVVAEDFIVCSVIEHWQAPYTLDDLIEVALELFVALPPRPSALSLDLLAQRFGHRLGNALLAPARQLAGELLGLRILDVEGQGKLASLSFFFLLPIILPSSG